MPTCHSHGLAQPNKQTKRLRVRRANSYMGMTLTLLKSLHEVFIIIVTFVSFQKHLELSVRISHSWTLYLCIMLKFFLSQFLLDIWYWVDFTIVYSHCTVNFIFFLLDYVFCPHFISKLFFLSSQEYMPQKLINYYSNNNCVNQMWTKAVVIGRKMFGLRSSPNKITKINWVLLLPQCAWHFWVYFIFF